MKTGIIGTGTVAQTIAVKLTSLGHDVMMGTRNTKDKLNSPAKGNNLSFGDWLKSNAKIKLGTFAEAAAFAEMVINASQGGSSVDALLLADAKNLKGKVLIDLANPLDFSKGMPPSLLPELSNTNSLGEEIQKTFPDAKVVKTLNTMWCGLMVNPALIKNGEHVNFICGNDSLAKQKVKTLLLEFGWKENNLMDLGDISNARATEAVLPIWLRVYGVKKTGSFNFSILS